MTFIIHSCIVIIYAHVCINSGESAFKHMMESFGWAKNPMINRIAEIPKDVPITTIYGSRSWIDSNVGYQMKYIRQDSYVHVEVC